MQGIQYIIIPTRSSLSFLWQMNRGCQYMTSDDFCPFTYKIIFSWTPLPPYHLTSYMDSPLRILAYQKFSIKVNHTKEVTSTNYFSTILEVFSKLPWLPWSFKIQYKRTSNKNLTLVSPVLYSGTRGLKLLKRTLL